MHFIHTADSGPRCTSINLIVFESDLIYATILILVTKYYTIFVPGKAIVKLNITVTRMLQLAMNEYNLHRFWLEMSKHNWSFCRNRSTISDNDHIRLTIS